MMDGLARFKVRFMCSDTWIILDARKATAMSKTSFRDWSDSLDAQAAAEAEAGDDTRVRLAAAFDAHIEDERRRVLAVTEQLGVIRKAKSLSQQQVSAMTGIDQAAISRIERGQINASVDTVSRLSESLGVHLALVDDEGRVVRA